MICQACGLDKQKNNPFGKIRETGLDSRRYDAKPSFDFGFATLLGQSRI